MLATAIYNCPAVLPGSPPNKCWSATRPPTADMSTAQNNARCPSGEAAPPASNQGLPKGNNNNSGGNPTEMRPCCACPDTRRERDDCVLLRGEENCHEFIEKHRVCLQSYGFIV